MNTQVPRYPVNYIGITQYYSVSHPADDFGWSTADPPIYAAADGTVDQAATDSADGANFVVIRHDNAVSIGVAYTLYWHLKSFSVTAGQRVKLGEQIGIMGRTGNATGVHLHFEFWITPADYMDWKLSDKKYYAVNPQEYVYCYPDQQVNPSTKYVQYYDPSDDNGSDITAGMRLVLQRARLYASAFSMFAAGRVTGIFYTWDASIIQNRIRITNTPDRVGVVGQVTGWINVSDIRMNEQNIYIVAAGDTLAGIAQRYNTTVTELLRLNPQITNANQIYIGQKIYLS